MLLKVLFLKFPIIESVYLLFGFSFLWHWNVIFSVWYSIPWIALIATFVFKFQLFFYSRILSGSHKLFSLLSASNSKRKFQERMDCTEVQKINYSCQTLFGELTWVWLWQHEFLRWTFFLHLSLISVGSNFSNRYSN